MNWQQFALIAAFLVFWFVLNRWLLPALGIPTCMSGQCGVPRPHGEGVSPSLPDGHDPLTKHETLAKGENP